MKSRRLRVLVSLAIIFACGWAMWVSGRTALSRLIVKYGMTTANAAALDRAIRLTPADAEGHYARAALSNYLDQPTVALSQLELAVSLRPRDYGLWLELGMTRDQLEDPAGALTAFNESVLLAPYYSKPRWQRGNLLFRMGRYDEALVDLRSAAASNPGLLPSLIDLAWGASGHDPNLTEQLMQVQGSDGHLALASFFANHDRPQHALQQFGQAKNVKAEKRRELVQALVTSGAYAEAFAIWRPTGSTGEQGTIYDGGFEGALTFEDGGFGWRPAHGVAGLDLSLDQQTPHTGARSLRIEFKGDSNPELPILTQLVVVEPGVRYKLSFVARTRKLVTGGPPLLVIKDATIKGTPRIASSMALPANSETWQSFDLEFVTGAITKAVLVSLQRTGCESSPCPIFGTVNLDSFAIERAARQ
jgi:hypothetical protein